MMATTINNSQGSNILSVGDMAIGGSLDSNGQATGRADTVNNSASTIGEYKCRCTVSWIGEI